MAEQPKNPLTVAFTCEGRAVGKMCNKLDVSMTEPMAERFAMVTDEGPFTGAMRQHRRRWRISLPG